MPPITVGIDVGGTKIQTAATRNRRVVGTARVATPRTGVDDIVTAMVETVREAVAAAGATLDEIAAVGIGTPGQVNSEKGTVSRAANVVGFGEEVPLATLVGSRLGAVDVHLDNDVRVAILGEYRRGAGRPYRNILGVFVGTGVGGGLILEGRLRDGRGSAGEIGHAVVKPGGRRCPCGREGCLEAYAGRGSIEATARRRQEKGEHTVLFEIMTDKGRDRVTSSVIADALHKGDRMTHDLIDSAVAALGVALASAQNVLDLEAIIVGGGLGDRLGAPFIDRVREAMTPHLFAADRAPAVLGTELGDLSGAVGAAVRAGG